MTTDGDDPPEDVREQFAILRAAGWRWLRTVSKGVAYNPTTREQITHEELRALTPQQVADRASPK